MLFIDGMVAMLVSIMHGRILDKSLCMIDNEIKIFIFNSDKVQLYITTPLYASSTEKSKPPGISKTKFQSLLNIILWPSGKFMGRI